MTVLFQFRALDAGQWYELPSGVDAQFGLEMSDISGLSMSYPRDGVNSARLHADTQVAALYDGVEIDNGRWTIQAASGKHAENDGPVTKWVGKSTPDLLRKVIVVRTNDLVFNAATPGGILVSLFQAAQAASRGAMAGVTWDFTALVDSAGVAWPKSLSPTYKPATQYLSILRRLVQDGLIEWRFRGLLLQVFVAGSMGRDQAIAPTPVELIAGRDYADTPWKSSVEDRANFALVLGDNGSSVQHTAPNTIPGPFGREEIGISHGGTTDPGTLQTVAEVGLARVANEREQLTRSLLIGAGPFLPVRDFTTSDWVLERVEGVAVRYRVRSLIIAVDKDGLQSASLVLNDKFFEQQVLDALKVAALSGTAVSGSGVPTGDTTTPNPITGLVVTTSAYTTSDGPRALLSLDWNAPTTNTDGSAYADAQDFIVTATWSAPPGGAAGSLAFYPTESTQVLSGLPVNTNVTVRVYARDNSGKRSTSVGGLYLTAKDTTPTAIPSAPVISSRPGAHRLAWDGKSASGAVYAPDFAGIELHRSTATGFVVSDATLIQTQQLPAPAAFAFVDTTGVYGTAYFYRFRSFDNSGNKSDGSGEATGTITQVSGVDVADKSLSSAKYADLSVIRAAIADLAVDNAKIGNVSVGKLTAGSLTADITLSARVKTADTGARVELNSLGLQAYDAGNQQTFNIDSASGSVMMVGVLSTAFSGARVEIGTTGGRNEVAFFPISMLNVLAPPKILHDVEFLTLRALHRTGNGALPSLVRVGSEHVHFDAGVGADALSNVRSRMQVLPGKRRTIVGSKYAEGPTAPATGFTVHDSEGIEDSLFFGQVSSTGAVSSAAITLKMRAVWSAANLNGSGQRANHAAELIMGEVGISTYNGGLHVGSARTDPWTGWSYRAVNASAYNVASRRAIKQDVKALAVDSLAAVRRAPISRWRYKADVALDGTQMPPPDPNGDPDVEARIVRSVFRAVEHIGPMADDLPVECLSETGDAVDLHAMVSLLWAAVQELSNQVVFKSR